MRRYLLARILTTSIAAFAVLIINFVIIHLAPGDPIHVFIGSADVPIEYIEELKARFGLDKPIYIQLLLYLKNIMSGYLGRSYIQNMPVFELIAERIPATLLLMGTGLVIATLMGIVLGVLAAKKRFSKFDNLVTVLSLLGACTPAFCSGLFLLLLFSIYLPVFPLGGMTSTQKLTGMSHVIDVAHHMILPSLTIGGWYLAMITQLTRSKMLEELHKDYIMVARAKGLGERVVVWKHALRNSLVPVATMVGINIAYLFGGAVVTETVYNWPGMGQLLYLSVRNRDYPVVMGILLLVSIVAIISNIIIDLLYFYLDPRSR